MFASRRRAFYRISGASCLRRAAISGVAAGYMRSAITDIPSRPLTSAGFARILALHAEAGHGQYFEPFDGDGGVASLALSKTAEFDPVQGCFDVGQRSHRCGSDGEGYLLPRIIPAGDGH